MSDDDSAQLPLAPDGFRFSLKALLAVVSVCGVLLGIFIPVVRATRESARIANCTNGYKQIGIGFHSYHDVYGRFLAPFVPGADGQPMHSWRMPIGPYLEASGLWYSYDYSKPWNSPANLALSNSVKPSYYFCASDSESAASQGVNKVMIVGADTAAPGFPGRTKAEFAAGLANTILVAEVAKSDIHWTEPRDLNLDEMSFQINDRATPSISSHHPGGAWVLMADGSVRFLDNGTAPSIVESLIKIRGTAKNSP